jgi:hypothetical protein
MLRDGSISWKPAVLEGFLLAMFIGHPSRLGNRMAAGNRVGRGISNLDEIAR